VNVASRLEQMTKAYNSELIISKQVAVQAALKTSEFVDESVEVRGRNEKLDILSTRCVSATIQLVLCAKYSSDFHGVLTSNHTG
ncbi:MAG: hypothetical protein ACPHHU_11170, partial [Paracoccaceae bacterium]